MRWLVVGIAIASCTQDIHPAPSVTNPNADEEQCSVTCLDSQTCCAGVCVDLQRNPDHCSECGHRCSGHGWGGIPACLDGRCAEVKKTCPAMTRVTRHGNFESVCCPETDKCGCQPGCPHSRRAEKKDIVYLDDADDEQLLARVRRLRLATYTYRTSDERHLGYILDDAPDLPSSVDDHVDLYAYTSVAIAALKAEDRKVRALEDRIAELEKR